MGPESEWYHNQENTTEIKQETPEKQFRLRNATLDRNDSVDVILHDLEGLDRGRLPQQNAPHRKIHLRLEGMLGQVRSLVKGPTDAMG
jgi:hypothetical protein